jgi:hypothetical protein
MIIKKDALKILVPSKLTLLQLKKLIAPMVISRNK